MGEAMNLLADLYSTIDSKKRQLKGLLSDPVETIRQGLLNFRDDQNKLLNDFGVGYQTPGYKSVLATPEQVKAARQSVADWGANQGIGAATVWHGSPHKFNKFDSSKIGTGEGAQAYGHGLYLAESPTVADSYAKELGDLEILHNGKTVGVFDKDPAANAAHQIRATGGDIDKAIRRAQNLYTGSWRDNVVSEIQKLGPGNVTENVAGNLYKVDLPDEAIAKMLDWDKPLRNQSPELQNLAKQHGVTDPNGEVGGVLGQGLYQALGDGKASGLTAEKLRALGIPGIRYLDGGSRGAGQGTSNYVVFPGNESLLTILERNGQPVGLLD